MRADSTGSIGAVLPAFVFTPENLISGAGGFAAAIAIGAFIGQAFGTVRPASDLERRRQIAIGGFIALMAMIGLILLSAKLS
jgi:hypothetical protein